MAISYVGNGAYNSGTTTVSLAYPSGLAAGDLLIAFVSTQPAAEGNTGVATPSGWTLIGHSGVLLAYSVYDTIYAFYQYYSSGSSQTFTASVSGTNIEGCVRAYSGTATSSPINAYGATTGTGGAAGDTNVVSISETYTSGELAVYASIESNNYYPSSVTHTLANLYENAGLYNSYYVGEYNWGAAPSTFTFTYSDSNSAVGGIVFTILPPSGGVTLAASPGSFTLTGEPSSFAVALAAGTGAFALTGEAAQFGAALAATNGAFTLTGDAGTFSTTLTGGAGSFTLTGEPGTFGTVLTGGVGNFTLTGDAGTFGIVLENAQGTFTLTGDTASFSNGGNVTLGAAPGAFTLTGDASTFSLGLAASDGVFTLTGDVGAFGLILETAPGSFSLTGEPTGFNYSIGASPGTFRLSGGSATFPGTAKATKSTTINSLVGYVRSQFPTISQNLNVFFTNELQKIQTAMRSTQQVQTLGQMGSTPNVGVPTTSNLPSGGAGLFKDTSGGGVYLAYNDGGTIKKVALT